MTYIFLHISPLLLNVVIFGVKFCTNMKMNLTNKIVYYIFIFWRKKITNFCFLIWEIFTTFLDFRGPSIFLSRFLHFEQVLQTCHHLMLNPSWAHLHVTQLWNLKKNKHCYCYIKILDYIYSFCVCVCKCICFTLAFQQFYMGSKGFT